MAPEARHHLGVYALIRNAEGQVLVIRKARGPYTGLLDLPGGSLEPLELLEETLEREIAEETGCTLTGQTQLGAVSMVYPFQKDGASYALRHVGILYQATISGTPRSEGDGEDSNGCLWLTPTAAALEHCTPFVRLALEKSN